jgi:hypothetical protein
MDNSRFPIDFDAVQKGDKFTPEQIETILGISQDSERFQLAVLAFVERIRDELDSRGKPATVAIVKKCVTILTDQEASIYNATEFDRGLRKSGRAHRRAVQVDVGLLDHDDRQRHERNLTTQAAILTGIKTARKLAISSHKRTTPGIGDK